MNFANGWARRDRHDRQLDDAGFHHPLAPSARWLLLAGFVLLAALRIPRAWLHGRFLDEEGTIFFAYAWHRPAWDALWRSFGGYLNLAANGIALADARLVQAGLVPLEAAPYLTMFAALAFQAIPAIILLAADDPWLRRPWARIAALLAIVLAPRTEEVFLNILHIQFHLALAAALILALAPPPSRAMRALSGAVLLAAPLCGPSAIILLPFFAWRALAGGDPVRIAQTLLLGFGSTLQMLAFYAASPVRGALIDPAAFGAMLFTRLVALPLAGSGAANRLGHALRASREAGGMACLLAAAGFVLCFATLLREAARRPRGAAIWFAMPALTLAIVAFGRGIMAANPADWFGVGAAERYDFLPLVLLALALVAMAGRPGAQRRPAYVVLLALTLLSGAITYRKPVRILTDGPAWNEEVRRWRLDRDRPLAGWPAEWSVDLSDADRPCPPRDSALDGPSYCENAWIKYVRKAIAPPPAAPPH